MIAAHFSGSRLLLTLLGSVFFLFALGALTPALPQQSEPVITAFYISPSGNDANPGTLAAPWRTVAKANASLQAGQTVFLRAGTYAESINPLRSGTANNYITYSNYASDPVTLTAKILLENRSYIRIVGLKFSMSGGHTPILVVTNSEHLIIDRNEFRMPALKGTKAWAFLKIVSMRHSLFTRNFVDRMDDRTYNGTNDGDAVWVSSRAEDEDTACNLFENNTIQNVSHVSLSLGGPKTHHNIVRNNRFLQHHSAVGTGGGAYRNVIESNTFICPSYIGTPSGHIQMTSDDNIIRKNILIDDIDQSWNGANDPERFISVYSYDPAARGDKGPITSADNNRIYHNTLYGDTEYKGYGHLLELARWAPEETVANNVIKNNIFFRAVTYSIRDYAGDTTLFAGNLILKNNVGDLQIRTGQIVSTLTGVKTLLPQTWLGSNIESNPLFVNEDGRDFRLSAASPAVDAGVSLTQTANSGVSSTLLTVQDAGYFTDGFDITEGDLIRIGTATAVRISGINYVTNTLTLSQARSWTVGAGVSLDFSGRAPDIGARDYTGVTPMTPSLGLSPTPSPTPTPAAGAAATARSGKCGLTGFEVVLVLLTISLRRRVRAS